MEGCFAASHEGEQNILPLSPAFATRPASLLSASASWDSRLIFLSLLYTTSVPARTTIYLDEHNLIPIDF